MDVSTLGTFEGGVGLLLIGLALATEGVQTAGGRALRARLERVFDRRGRAFALGIATGVSAPASRAQPLAVVSFASGGLLGLRPALWAALGAAIAGAATAWAVALAPSPLVTAPILTALTLGALLLWVSGSTGIGSWGRTLGGWALLLLGTRGLHQAFLALGDGVHLDPRGLALPLRAALLIAAGGGLTTLVRSAGLVISVTLCAAAAGVLELDSAMALLIGSQIGIGAAALGAVRAERGDGKRTAVGIVAQHAAALPVGVLLMAFALPLLPELAAGPMVVLASFLTLLWAVGALITMPLLEPLGELLENHLESEEGEGVAALSVPELAVAGIEHRLDRLAILTQHLARHVLVGERVSEFRVESSREDAERIVREVEIVLERLRTRALTRDLARRITGAGRRARLYLELLDELVRIREQARAGVLPDSGPLLSRLRQLRFSLLHLLESCVAPYAFDWLDRLQGELRSVEAHVYDLERATLLAVSLGQRAPDTEQPVLGHLTGVRRLGRLGLELAAADAAVRQALRVPWRRRLASWILGSDQEVELTLQEPSPAPTEENPYQRVA